VPQNQKGGYPTISRPHSIACLACIVGEMPGSSVVFIGLFQCSRMLVARYTKHSNFDSGLAQMDQNIGRTYVCTTSMCIDAPTHVCIMCPIW